MCGIIEQDAPAGRWGRHGEDTCETGLERRTGIHCWPRADLDLDGHVGWGGCPGPTGPPKRQSSSVPGAVIRDSNPGSWPLTWGPPALVIYPGLGSATALQLTQTQVQATVCAQHASIRHPTGLSPRPGQGSRPSSLPQVGHLVRGQDPEGL